jgi:uncharacterized protein YjbJ (UPF0337 family)
MQGFASDKETSPMRPYLVAYSQDAISRPWTLTNRQQSPDRGEITMKPSTEDKTAGNLHEVKGAIKQKVGEITKHPKLEADGMAEKNAGKVQHAVGKIEKAVGV